MTAMKAMKAIKAMKATSILACNKNIDPTGQFFSAALRIADLLWAVPLQPLRAPHSAETSVVRSGALHVTSRTKVQTVEV